MATFGQQICLPTYYLHFFNYSFSNLVNNFYQETSPGQVTGKCIWWVLGYIRINPSVCRSVCPYVL